MAHRAVIGKPIVMRVVFHVTSAAVLRRITEYLRLMAGRTFGICVFTEEREMRQVMIEEYVFLPGFFIVTIAAHCSLRTAVRVIAFVALATTCQRLRLIQGLDVAR
jgi:hypothetical protein